MLDYPEKLEFLLYKNNDEDYTVNVIVKDESIWLTQKSMSDLFNVGVPAISKHLSNIFKEGELKEEVVVSILEIPTKHGAIEGKIQYNQTKLYNLDAIISVGYRVNSKQATNFRIWATSVLKEYIIKGFVLNDERLAQGKKTFDKDYFKELLERVQSIRASERRIWQQITDIFAECSFDYDKNSDVTKEFYAMVQNRFHYAITGMTAAEIVYEKSDHRKDHMGLTTWKNAPEGRILKSDVSIAKNYLDEKSIKKLERLVTGYFDYVEDLIEDEVLLSMEDFSNSINDFLQFRKYKILEDKGRISAKQAKEKADKEYQNFNQNQKIISDFDKFIKEKNNEIKKHDD